MTAVNPGVERFAVAKLNSDLESKIGRTSFRISEKRKLIHPILPNYAIDKPSIRVLRVGPLGE